MAKKAKKRALTLLEIMIVIFLIGVISAVVGYNLKGTTAEGKAFKTSESAKRIHEVLALECARGLAGTENLTGDNIEIDQVQRVLEKSGLIKNPKSMMKDGWGTQFKISHKDDDFIISSDAFKNHCVAKGMNDEQMREKYPHMF